MVGDLIAGRGLHDRSVLSVVDRACAQTLELLVRQTGHTDDITLLAAQRRLPPPPLSVGGPGAPPAIPVIRGAVDAWVGVLEAGEADRMALTHTVVELVTNAFEHARPDRADLTVTVTAELGDDGEARLTVADNGRWQERARPGDDAYRQGHGFGLAMAAGLADHLDVHRGENGTTVTIRHRLSRSARLLIADQVSQGDSRAAEDVPGLMLILDQPSAPSSRIAVHGPLDVSTVDELGVELDRYTLGGTHELVVDLTAVTHLASAAVAELYRTKPDDGERRYPLRLYAPPGSAAHHQRPSSGGQRSTGRPVSFRRSAAPATRRSRRHPRLTRVVAAGAS